MNKLVKIEKTKSQINAENLAIALKSPHPMKRLAELEGHKAQVPITAASKNMSGAPMRRGLSFLAQYDGDVFVCGDVTRILGCSSNEATTTIEAMNIRRIVECVEVHSAFHRWKIVDRP